mmetsp:Transcript_31237/g.79792  ORF Transcript_31237/g.79792 Transcript_31237/m.79792 type:complete len:253 (-) Transcript_31237:48-806(-)
MTSTASSPHLAPMTRARRLRSEAGVQRRVRRRPDCLRSVERTSSHRQRKVQGRAPLPFVLGHRPSRGVQRRTSAWYSSWRSAGQRTGPKSPNSSALTRAAGSAETGGPCTWPRRCESRRSGRRRRTSRCVTWSSSVGECRRSRGRGSPRCSRAAHKTRSRTAGTSRRASSSGVSSCPRSTPPPPPPPHPTSSLKPPPSSLAGLLTGRLKLAPRRRRAGRPACPRSSRRATGKRPSSGALIHLSIARSPWAAS